MVEGNEGSDRSQVDGRARHCTFLAVCEWPEKSDAGALQAQLGEKGDGSPTVGLTTRREIIIRIRIIILVQSEGSQNQ